MQIAHYVRIHEWAGSKSPLIYFILFCFVLFCFVCVVLWCFVLFCFVLFYFVLFCFVLFYFIFVVLQRWVDDLKTGAEQATGNSYDPKTGKPITQPLKTLHEVLSWTQGLDFFNVATIPLSEQCRKMEKRPRTLVCHDMKGGYIEDRSVDLMYWSVWNFNITSPPPPPQ